MEWGAANVPADNLVYGQKGLLPGLQAWDYVPELILPAYNALQQEAILPAALIYIICKIAEIRHE